MRLTLNFSTCPNDTFMFGALVNNLIDTKGYRFNLHLADIEQLNGLVECAIPDISKISFGVFPFVMDKYQLLNTGAALGKGVGPLVVSKRKIFPDEIPFVDVALPGERTTANLLFSLAFPFATKKKFYLFSQIMDAVLSNEVDAGVIIHESRFTYEQKGLLKVIDLGHFWEGKTGLPTPLGGIVIRQDLPLKVKVDINHLIRQSVEYGFSRPADVMPFVKQYAQEMDADVMRQHIALYVNNYSLGLGTNGRKAIVELLCASGRAKNDFDGTDFFVD